MSLYEVIYNRYTTSQYILRSDHCEITECSIYPCSNLTYSGPCINGMPLYQYVQQDIMGQLQTLRTALRPYTQILNSNGDLQLNCVCNLLVKNLP